MTHLLHNYEFGQSIVYAILEIFKNVSSSTNSYHTNVFDIVNKLHSAKAKAKQTNPLGIQDDYDVNCSYIFVYNKLHL